MTHSRRCANCGSWEISWHLTHYYGVTGAFCDPCYRLVEHDSKGQPVDPGGYLMARLRQAQPLTSTL